MPTSLVKLSDGTLVEVQVPADQVQEISGTLAQKVNAALDSVQTTILDVCRSMATSLDSLAQTVAIDEAEIEFGLSFEAEGNLYITKASSGANLQVKIKFKRSA